LLIVTGKMRGDEQPKASPPPTSGRMICATDWPALSDADAT
jgi:hypothetical protein